MLQQLALPHYLLCELLLDEELAVFCVGLNLSSNIIISLASTTSGLLSIILHYQCTLITWYGFPFSFEGTAEFYMQVRTTYHSFSKEIIKFSFSTSAQHFISLAYSLFAECKIHLYEQKGMNALI